MEIKILAIYISADHDFRGHHGNPRGHNPNLQPDTVECVAGQGLVGDRYFGYKEDYKGQITFFDEAVHQAAQDALDCHGTPPEAYRRNILTRGIDLNTLIDKTFRIGEATFYGTQECAPCYWMDEAFCPGMEDFLKGRGGLRARILTDGILNKGPTRLQIEPATPNS